MHRQEHRRQSGIWQQWRSRWMMLWLALVWCLWLVPISIDAQSLDVERLRRSVVRIVADRGNIIGSGALIKVEGRTGYILTAYHVIHRDVDRGAVKVELYTEEPLEARISRNRIDP